jgi:hypothetical protein
MRLAPPLEGPIGFATATRLQMRHGGDRMGALAEAERDFGP